jgi:hypothetical protein
MLKVTGSPELELACNEQVSPTVMDAGAGPKLTLWLPFPTEKEHPASAAE